MPAPVGAYPPARRWLRPLWGGAALFTNLPRVAASWVHDVTLLQRELISTLATLEPMTKRPRVLDVDDAIFLYRGGSAARRLAQVSDAIVCGNSFLAEWFRSLNRNTCVVPTAIDTERYVPRGCARQGDNRVVGWIGTSGNLKYLHGIEMAILRAMEEVPVARLCVVSDRAPEFRRLSPDRVDFVRWAEREEVAVIHRMDVGIMPLEDTPWARGKCSFKMLQYMACGLPVLVSPVGMNAEVLALGEFGIGASNEAQWVDGLVALLESDAFRARLGAEGRRIAESTFSIPVLAPHLARCLRGDWR
jgi:glycosyltransferase involved in cell wall biosynthesis